MKKLLLLITLLSVYNVQAQYTFEQIDIWTGTSPGNAKYLTEYDGKLFFQAREIAPSFRKLYSSNGTSSGTLLIAPNLNNGNGYSPESLTIFNNELYFTAFVSGLGTELFKTDGTDAGTQLIKDVRTGSSGGLDTNFNENRDVFIEFNNELYFRGTTNSSIQLWKTDGTETGTVSVKNFEDTTFGAPSYISKDDKFILGVVYNNELFFKVQRGSISELWKTDGTTVGTELVRGSFSRLDDLIVYDNLLYFSANDNVDSTKGDEVWVSDGTTAGTTLKFDIFPNDLNPFFGFGSLPRDFFIFNNTLFFKASSYNATNNEIIGAELWKTDGTTASLVKDIKTGNLSSGLNITRFTVLNNELYFLASDDTTSNFEIWKTDGTENGTIKAVSLADTGETIEFRNAKVYNNKLFYHSAQQLWVTDGSGSGTQKLTNVGGDIIQTTSGVLQFYNNKLWFAGNSSSNGTELTSLLDQATLSIIENEQSRFTLSPNPTSAVLNIKGLYNKTQYIITTITGKTLKQGTLNNLSKSIEVNNIQSGVYILKLTNGYNSQSLKFIKN